MFSPHHSGVFLSAEQRLPAVESLDWKPGVMFSFSCAVRPQGVKEHQNKQCVESEWKGIVFTSSGNVFAPVGSVQRLDARRERALLLSNHSYGPLLLWENELHNIHFHLNLDVISGPRILCFTLVISGITASFCSQCNSVLLWVIHQCMLFQNTFVFITWTRYSSERLSLSPNVINGSCFLVSTSYGDSWSHYFFIENLFLCHVTWVEWVVNFKTHYLS